MRQPTTLDNTLGVLLLGMAVAALFLGMSTLQAYVYYHKYTRDTLIYKYSVGFLWVLDTIHLLLVIHSVYFYLVTNFGNPAGLTQIIWSMKLQVPFNVVIVSSVQFLYTVRVWLLGGLHRNLILGYLCAATLAGAFVISLILIYKTYAVDSFHDIASFSWVVSATFASATIMDALIAAAMCYYLAKSKGNSSRLNSRLSKLMAYTLNSGLITSAFSLTCLFTWVFLPNTLDFEGILFFLTKLYVASYFAMLNARAPIKKEDTESGVPLQAEAIPKFSPRPPGSSPSPFPPPSAKQIQAENYHDV